MAWTGWADRDRAVRWAAACAVLVGVLAGCGSSGPGSSAASAPASPAKATGSASASSSASAAGFADIVEPWDPGHPARPESSPASCATEQSTLDIEVCYEAKTETTDVTIDAVQLEHYESASAAGKAAILAQDSAWLAARGPVCSVAFHTGGTLDEISIAACLLAESTARLDAVRGITPPEARLKSTDSIDPDELSWYTTPEGSRIAEIDTQGDQTGGAIIAWVIVGGADGFVVNPRQFYYQDGSFIDPGIIEPPAFSYHRVGTGQMYQFDIDYSRLSADPNATKGTGGYEYVLGTTPVAIWQ